MQQPHQQYGNYNTPSGDSGGSTGSGIQQRVLKFCPLIIRILACIQILFSVLIFGMELGIIAYYALYVNNTSATAAELSVGPVTAAGIWCCVGLDVAIWFLFRLAKDIGNPKMWLNNLITQAVAFVFTIILIGITGNYVDKFKVVSTLCSSVFSDSVGSASKYLCSKYQLHQVQLAFAILLLFTQLLFIALYLYLRHVLKPSMVGPPYPMPPQQQYQSNSVPQYVMPSNYGPTNQTTSNLVSSGNDNQTPLKEIQCEHCSAVIYLPMPKGTYVHTTTNRNLTTTEQF